MSHRDEIAAILKENRKTEDRIAALVDYVESEIDVAQTGWLTGIPGGIVESEEIAPGLILHRNCNGSIVEIEIER